MDTSKPIRSHELRKGRHSIPSAYYHIIIVTHKRKPVLSNNTATSIIFDAFNYLEAKGRIRWLCIMIMPDHLHTVIQLGNTEMLSKVMHSLKRFTAREFNKKREHLGPLWQRGYSDFGIRDDRALNNIINYCYENPVRKGIVKTAKEYPYWRCKYKMM